MIVALEKEVELPEQIPNVMQSRVHPLPAKWTMNMSGIAGNENAAFAQPRCLAVMDAKIGAPVNGSCFDPAGSALR